jgi:hypothetical protein
MSGLPGALVELFTGNQSGKSHLAGVGSNGRYGRIPYSTLQNWQLAEDVSSATLFNPSSGACTLLLFTPDTFLSDFQGQYAEFTNFSGSAWPIPLSNIPALDGGTWDKRATSALVVWTFNTPETRLSARNEWIDNWISTIDGKLAELPYDVTRDGDPLFTWDPFPTGSQYLSPNVVYLKISQGLKISVPVFNDYNASVDYWIRLFLSQGKLAGHVGQCTVFVDSGLCTGTISGILGQQALSAIPTINKAITTWAATKPSPLGAVYLLPGPPRPIPQGTDFYPGYTQRIEYGDATIALAAPTQMTDTGPHF